jgi:hypothetical protein
MKRSIKRFISSLKSYTKKIFNIKRKRSKYFPKYFSKKVLEKLIPMKMFELNERIWIASENVGEDKLITWHKLEKDMPRSKECDHLACSYCKLKGVK